MATSDPNILVKQHSQASVPRTLAILCLCAVFAATASAGQPARPNVQLASYTGLAEYVISDEGPGIPIRGAAGQILNTPTEFFAEHGQLFGVTDVANQLVETKAGTDLLGHTHTTFQQVHQGVPVFGALLKVHQNVGGEVICANGHFHPIPSKLSPVPTLSAADAQLIALSQIGAVGVLEIERCELVVVDTAWYGNPATGERLAYYVMVISPDAPLRKAFFINAHTGQVLDQWNALCTLRQRRIYDAQQGANIPGTLVRSEGGPPVTPSVSITSQVAFDANAAYDFYGDIYGYYFRAFGRDSIDAASLPMVASVNVNASWLPCPNAAWLGLDYGQMVFCLGTATDDIVGHEMTHGVTESTANLIYQNQPGQLNESFSDVFGELIDLFNGNAAFAGAIGGTPLWPSHQTGAGLDAPNKRRVMCSQLTNPKDPVSQWVYSDGVRWLMGEDAAAFGGAIRDLWNPTCFQNPDRANSAYQNCESYDNGGVHLGAGIPSHAFAMLTDGATFNGYTIWGIGPIKSGAVWYRALTTYLTPTSDFEDAYHALNQAAADLVGTFPNDPRSGAPSASVFTLSDAGEVDKALRAVEMNTAGRCGSTSDIMDYDPPVECAAKTIIFSETFENGLGAWSAVTDQPAPPTSNNWRITTQPLPYLRPGKAAYCPDLDNSCYVPTPTESGVHRLISPLISLPANVTSPTLSFTHAVATEMGCDGGNVEISVDQGNWQLVPLVAFYYNPYNALTLDCGDPAHSTNPLKAQPGFSGGSKRWATSLAYLGGFVSGGQTLQVRFNFGKDDCAGVDGWYVDDVTIYDCQLSQDCNGNNIPDDVEISGGAPPTVVVQQLPYQEWGWISDADGSGIGVESLAEDFTITRSQRITAVNIWGTYYPSNTAGLDFFTVIFHQLAGNGTPGTNISSQSGMPITRTKTGKSLRYWDGTRWRTMDEWKLSLSLPSPVDLQPGNYFVEVYNNTAGNPDTFLWEWADYVGDGKAIAAAQQCPGTSWTLSRDNNSAIEIIAAEIGLDCNGNGIPDDCDIKPGGSSQDCNGDGIPDDCTPPLTVAAGADLEVAVGRPSPPLSMNITATPAVPPLSYLWQVVSGPSTSGLSDPHVANPRFTAPLEGSYQLRLTVTDSGPGPCSKYAEITIHAAPLRVAVPSQLYACLNQTTALGGFINVTGGSPPYAYAWAVLSGPSSFDLFSENSANPTITTLVAADCVVQVTVSDSSDPPFVIISPPVPIHVGGSPTVSASTSGAASPIVVVGESLQLGGSPTASGGRPPYTYAWSIPTNPGGAGLISDATAPNPTFTASAKGGYTVRVQVADAAGCAAQTQFSITVVADPPSSLVPVGRGTSTAMCGACGAQSVVPSAVLLVGYLVMYRSRSLRRSNLRK